MRAMLEEIPITISEIQLVAAIMALDTMVDMGMDHVAGMPAEAVQSLMETKETRDRLLTFLPKDGQELVKQMFKQPH